jgi:acetyl/propionyl-CoA carboxylase alpha subunit
MKYTSILNGQERELEITPLESNVFKIVIDGQVHEIEACHCGNDLISLLIDNLSYDISYSFDGDLICLDFRNQYFNIEVLDERKMRMRRVRSSLDLSGPEIIKTSMPGRVIKVLKQTGEKVDAGAGIIIIEAMKMENEIQCRNPGVVKKVNVKPGQTVESEAVLVEIEPD